MFRTYASAAAILGVMTLTACSGGPAGESGDGERVDLRLDWTWGPQHSAYLVADKLGYFEEAGLDVTISEGEGSAVTGTVVGSGDAEFGIMGASEVLIAASKGVDVQAVYTVLKSSPTAIVYNKSRVEIDDVTDLYDRKLGVTTQSTVYKEYEALAASSDLDRSRVEEVAVGAQLVPAMLSDQVDAVVAFSNNQYPLLLVEGKDVGSIRFEDLGFPDVPSASVVVNGDFAADHPDVVEKFVGAVKRGWQYVNENPDEALELLAEERPEVNEEFSAEALPLVLELMGDDPEQFGSFDAQAWADLEEMYDGQGLLDGDIELVGGVYDDQFVS